MRIKDEKYPLEVALEKLLNEARKSLKRASKFFFEIPSKKMDKYIWIMETLSWLFLTAAIFYRLRG